MAHPTDYASQNDISRLRRSNHNPHKIVESNAYVLAINFLNQNPNWAIDSLVSYLLATYSDYGMNREVISQAIKTYIMDKS